MPERAEPELLPDWGKRERAQDLLWIQANVDILWPTAQLGYETAGRGAVVVDVQMVTPDLRDALVYANQATVEHVFGSMAAQFVREYDPNSEFITALLKSQDRISSYRLGVSPRRSQQKTNGHL